jgi:hypothetical protein
LGAVVGVSAAMVGWSVPSGDGVMKTASSVASTIVRRTWFYEQVDHSYCPVSTS